MRVPPAPRSRRRRGTFWLGSPTPTRRGTRPPRVRAFRWGRGAVTIVTVFTEGGVDVVCVARFLAAEDVDRRWSPCSSRAGFSLTATSPGCALSVHLTATSQGATRSAAFTRAALAMAPISTPRLGRRWPDDGVAWIEDRVTRRAAKIRRSPCSRTAGGRCRCGESYPSPSYEWLWNVAALAGQTDDLFGRDPGRRSGSGGGR